MAPPLRIGDKEVNGLQISYGSPSLIVWQLLVATYWSKAHGVRAVPEFSLSPRRPVSFGQIIISITVLKKAISLKQDNCRLSGRAAHTSAAWRLLQRARYPWQRATAAVAMVTASRARLPSCATLATRRRGVVVQRSAVPAKA